MKGMISCLCCSLLLLACVKEPRIFFEKRMHHFGSVSQRKSLSVTFPFENRGSETLVINRVKAG